MITLNGHHLSITEVWRVAVLGCPCGLANEARPLIQRSRKLVESLAAQPRAIYGINTGFGPLSAFRVSNEELAAVSHLGTLKLLRADPAMSSMVFFGINSSIAVSAVAEAFLAADIERAKGNLEAAIDGFETAIDLESELTYTEPPDWFFPVRHALGDAQLAAGDFPAAERTFSDDLAVYPENGWSLFGLANALRAQGKEAEAAAVDARFAAAWAHADIQLTGTRL